MVPKWKDSDGREWFFGCITCGHLIKAKRQLGIDLLNGSPLPKNAFQILDVAEIVLAEQMEINGVSVERLAELIAEDLPGFFDAFIEGLTFFWMAHQDWQRVLSILMGKLSETETAEIEAQLGTLSTC